MRKLILLILLLATRVNAQTVVNPGNVSFLASPDHNVVVSTVPVVDHYELTTITSVGGSGVVVWTLSLGKPTPDATNTIKVAVPKFDTLVRGTYTVTVSAVNTKGIAGVSSPSLPFVETGIPAAPGIPTVSN